MRLYTIKTEEKEKVAVLGADDLLYPLDTFGVSYRDMNDLIVYGTKEDWHTIREKAADVSYLGQKRGYTFAQVTICAPIPVPRQDIVCLGVNYDEHIKETHDVLDFSKKQYTVYFSKRVNEAMGDGSIIPKYSFVDSLDYEAELGVIIGKDCKNVTAKHAGDYILGYTIINDLSARNLQLRHQQWYVGKSLDGYTAMGPCIVTADEVENVQNLTISCMVNGEVRQNSNTKYMIQPVAAAIEELSHMFTLKAGSVIATGTPGGVGMGMNPPQYLQSGDKVVCEIAKIGSLTNSCE